MICVQTVKKFCKDDISQIENYANAMHDAETWDCHHRDEIKILPSGMLVIRSAKDLIENNRYFNCPANELIFMKHSEHSSLHSKYPIKSRQEALTAMHTRKKGTTLSECVKHKISIATKRGIANMSEKERVELIERQSASLKKYCDTNQGKSALSKATRGTQWYNNGKINVRSFDCPLGFVKGRLKFR